MTELSRFYGIKIELHYELNSKHSSPHIHAKYNEFEAAFTFDGKLIAGKFPVRASKIVNEWVLKHSDELQNNWEKINRGEQPDKIEPLK